MRGRIRVQVERIKKSPEKARQLERRLRGRRGIERVASSTATGSVTILYDPDRIGEDEIIQALGGQANWAGEGTRSGRRKKQPPMHQRVAESLVAGLLEVAVRGLVSALA